MWGLIGNAIAFLIGLFTKAKAPPAAERAAAAETKLATQEANHEAVSVAIDARRRADERVVLDPASVRAPDPYSRD